MNRAEISTAPQTVADRSVAQPIPLQQRTWLQILRTYGTPLILLALVLSVTALLLLIVLLSPPVWSLDVGASTDAHFVAGFLPPQHEGTLTYRWSSAQAQVLLPRTSVGMLRLRLHGDELAIITNQHVRLERNGAELATLPLRLGWRIYQLLLPPGPAPAPGVGVFPLDLVSLRDGSAAGDSDAPGMPVDWVQIAPRTGATTPIQLPLQRTLNMIWSLGVLAGILWHIARSLWPQSRRLITSVWISGVLAIVAAGLIRWVQHEPHLLDWAWPAPPWVLVPATLLLVGSWVSPTAWERWHGEPLEHWDVGRVQRWIGAGCLCILAALAHLLLLVGGPMVWRGLAALFLLGLPGALLALLVFRSEHDRLERTFLMLCYALALPIPLLFGLHALPGPLHGWHVLLAVDALSGLIGMLLLRTMTIEPKPSTVSPAPSGEAGKTIVARWRSGSGTMLVLLAVLLLAGMFRFPFLGTAEFQGDETHVLLRAAVMHYGQEAVLFLRDKGPAEILLTAGPLVLTGQINELIARLPFALAGLSILPGTFLLARRMLLNTRSSPSGAVIMGLIASIILALDGFLIAFARIVQYQSIVMLMMVGAMWCVWRFYEGVAYAQRYLVSAAAMAAIGMLAHYDGIFVLPALAWLVLAGGWRRGWHMRQWITESVPSMLVGSSLLCSFFIPFLLSERFRERTPTYLSYRIGLNDATLPLYNNLVDFYGLATFYNTAYQIDWLALALAAGMLTWLVLYGRPRWLGWGLAVLLLAGCVLLVRAPERFVIMDVNGAIFVFMLPLAALALSPATPPVLRTLVIWFSIPFMAESFVIAVPRTHFYTILIPAALLTSLAVVSLGQWLAAHRMLWGTAGLSVAGMVLVLRAMPYLWLVFVCQVPEYHRSFPAVYSQVYRASYGTTLPTEHGYFGFARQDGWKVIGQLYRQGIFQGSYASNQKRVIVGWYIDAFRCGADPDYYFVGLRGKDADDHIQMRIWQDYHRYGSVFINGIRTIDMYRRQPIPQSPQVFHLEDYEAAFDARTVPDFQLQRILLELAPQYALDRSWQQGVRLRGYDLDRQSLTPGETARISLFWQAMQPVSTDYEVFVELLDPTDRKVATVQPYCESRPPAEWYQHYFIDTSFTVTVDAALPPDTYTLYVGLRHRVDGTLLPLVDGTDALRLTTLTVERS